MKAIKIMPIPSTIKGKLKGLRDNSLFTKLETLSKEKYDPDGKELDTDIVQRFFEKKNIDITTEDDWFPFQILIEIILLIFGHNIIGKTLALLVTSILAIPMSFVMGFPAMVAGAVGIFFLFILIVGFADLIGNDFFNDLFEELFDQFEYFWHFFGLIVGGFIFCASAIAGAIIILLLLPFIYLFCVGSSYVAIMEYIMEYLSAKTNISEEGCEIKGKLHGILDELKTSDPVGV